MEDINIKRVRAARDHVAWLMASESRFALGYAPVFERLDREVAAMEAAQQSDPIARARAIVAQMAMA